MTPYASPRYRTPPEAELEADRDAASDRISETAEEFWLACVEAYRVDLVGPGDLATVQDAIAPWFSAELPGSAQMEMDGAGKRLAANIARINSALGRR